MRYSFISLALFAAGAFSAAVEIPPSDVVSGPNPGAIRPSPTPSGRSQPRPSLVAPNPGAVRGSNSTVGMCIDLGSRAKFGGGRNNSTRPRLPKTPGQGGNKNNGTRPAVPKPTSLVLPKPTTEGPSSSANYEIADEAEFEVGKKKNGTGPAAGGPRGNDNGKKSKGGKGKGLGKKGGRGGRKRMQCQRFASKGCAGAQIAKGDRNTKAESIRCTPIVGGGAQGRNATRPGAPGKKNSGPGKKDNKPKKDAEELEFEEVDEDEVEGEDEDDSEEFDGDDEPELNGRSIRLF